MFFMRICYVIFIVLRSKKVLLQPRICDLSPNPNVEEGNIGEIKTFPWLGVLRVHIHEGENFKIALTGLVLVKRKYGIVHAADVVKVHPTKIGCDIKEYVDLHFRTTISLAQLREGKAMFILNDTQSWSCSVQGYSLHPEYEYATYTTIALVKLAEELHERLLPICWPDYLYRANQLYVLGYTDEDQFLEKIMYKIQNIDTALCDEFYDRIKVNSDLYKPTHYHCGFAENNKKHCEWDNGMVLASNSTGPWVLIGFGMRAAGCAAPSRFINILPYLPWIESSTDQTGI